MRLIDQFNPINNNMAQQFEDLLSYPLIRRGNYQFKVSIYKKNFVLVFGHHIMEPDKFLIKQFTSLEEAAIYLEYIVEKDIYG